MVLPVEEAERRGRGSAELLTAGGLAGRMGRQRALPVPLVPPSPLWSAGLRQLLCAVQAGPQSPYQSLI